MLGGLVDHDDAGVYWNDESESWNVNVKSVSWSSPIGVCHESYIHWDTQVNNCSSGFQENKHTKSTSNCVAPRFTTVSLWKPLFRATVWNSWVWKASCPALTLPSTGGYTRESMVTWYKPWFGRSAPYSCNPEPKKVKETVALTACVTI